MLDRRFAAYVADRKRPVDERGKFSYPPSLIVIDGGLGQLGRAVKILAKYELDIPVIGLAKRADVPATYLSKVLATLGRAGLVQATRGARGGYRLAKSPDQIHLIDVIELFDGPRARPQFKKQTVRR